MKKPLVLFGDSAFAEIAFEYFSRDSTYEVVAFTVTSEFLREETLFSLPVVPFENIESAFPPEQCDMHIALAYASLNRVRKKFYQSAKLKGYTLANYISSRAFVWHNVELGDNIFIFENNTVQPFTKLGSNIVLWSGNHIGHHSRIQSHCFFSSQVVVSGFCDIGESCFFGVNSSIANNIAVANDCFIGAGALIVKNLETGSFVRGMPNMPESISTYQKFNVE